MNLPKPPRTAQSAPSLSAGPRARWWTLRRIAGVAMMAAGGVGVVIGIPLLAIDGENVEHNVFHYNTGAGGGALLGIGAALAVIGGVVLLTARGPTPTRAVLAPSLGPGGAGLVGGVEF